jgi:uncharacterized cupredoxin-like copper-binding protein
MPRAWQLSFPPKFRRSGKTALENMEKEMRKLFLLTTLTVLTGVPVVASETNGNDAHGAHSGHAGQMLAGMPGSHRKVSRTVHVKMKETDDGEMIFSPSSMAVKQGETIRFMVVNKGEIDHEFVLDTPERNALHKEIMASRTETHTAPNAVTLEPGQDGEIIWQFSNEGAFEFACLIPGHYDAGMFGKIAVN